MRVRVRHCLCFVCIVQGRKRRIRRSGRFMDEPKRIRYLCRIIQCVERKGKSACRLQRKSAGIFAAGKRRTAARHHRRPVVKKQTAARQLFAARLPVRRPAVKTRDILSTAFKTGKRQRQAISFTGQLQFGRAYFFDRLCRLDSRQLSFEPRPNTRRGSQTE